MHPSPLQKQQGPQPQPSRALAVGLVSLLASGLGWPATAASPGCTAPGTVLNMGFYTSFRPLSYSADPLAGSTGFNQHQGYEAALLDALEAMDGAGLQFARRGIAEWPDIWLRAAEPEFDIIGGGITILDSRTRDAAGNTAVRFTSGHVTFRQSLLVRAADQQRLSSYEQLDGTVRIGALAGTTGEHRLLVLTGLAEANGQLMEGIHVETPRELLVTDGSPDWVIAPSGGNPALDGRTKLYSPSGNKPTIIYSQDEREMLSSLLEGTIDAVARGEIGNLDASAESSGDLVISALDSSEELAGFVLDHRDGDLAACLSEKLAWLTDHRRIGYGQWRDDPDVFMKRAIGYSASDLDHVHAH